MILTTQYIASQDFKNDLPLESKGWGTNSAQLCAFMT